MMWIVWVLNGITVVASGLTIYFAVKSGQHSKRAQEALARIRRSM